MLALRFYNQRDIRLENLPKPKPEKEEVLIKVTQAGISQTQINEFIEGPFFINKKPHPLTGKAIPLIPCQEYGGIIEDVGEGVDRSLIGKQVAVLPLISCGNCEYCLKGKENLCEKIAYHGLLGLDGGFAEYSVVNVKNIFPVEKEELLTFIEPILVGMNTFDIYRHYNGKENFKKKKILILGAGPVGISVGAVWRDYVKADVVINDILSYRMKKANEIGFRTIEKKDLEKNSFDVVIDAAGMDPLSTQSAIVEGIKYIKKGGFLISVGSYFHPVEFIPSELTFNEKNIISSMAYSLKLIKELPDVLKSLKVNFKTLIQEIPLEKIIDEGYYRAEVEKESFVRIVVRC
ncbi:alcohol dehydrogenase catalytic domain-containing protein [Persephonella sp.]